MLIHLANLIILASFLVSDVMWLRALSIVGGGVWICYFTVAFAEVNWPGIGWNVVFTAINIWYIIQLILERRPIQFTEHERNLKYLVAPDLDQRTWSQLIKQGQVLSGDELRIEEATSLDSVYLVMSGELGLENTQLDQEYLSPGELFGGLSYLSDIPFDQHVIETKELSLIMWQKGVLESILKDAPKVEAIFQKLFGDEIARRKLKNNELDSSQPSIQP